MLLTYASTCVLYFKNSENVLKADNAVFSLNMGEAGGNILSYLWLGWSGTGCHGWPLS